MRKCNKFMAVLLSLAMIIATVPQFFASAEPDRTSGIDRIEAENTTVFEGNKNGFATEIDSEGTFEYKIYDYGTQMTVYYKDPAKGPFVFQSDDAYTFFGESVFFFDDQSRTNEWGKGEHKAKAQFLDYECELTVTVIDNPIDRLEVFPQTVMEGVDGYWEDECDEQGKPTGRTFFNYWFDMVRVDVVFKDRTVCVCDDVFNGYYYNGIHYDFDFELSQSYDSQLKTGENIIPVYAMGVKGDFVVTVEESPVKSVTVPDYTLYRDINKNGFGCFYDPDFTVEFKDGTTAKGEKVDGRDWEPKGVDYNEKRYFLEYEKEDLNDLFDKENGTYTEKVKFMGVETEVKFTVADSPVTKVEFDKMVLTENIDGYYQEDEEFFVYLFDPTFTVTLSDGTELHSNDDGFISYNDGIIVAECTDNQYENHWKVGENTCHGAVSKAEADFTVEVLPCPYTSLELVGGREPQLKYTKQDGTVVYEKITGFDSEYSDDGFERGTLTTDVRTYKNIVLYYDFEKAVNYKGQNVTIEIGSFKTEAGVDIPIYKVEDISAMYNLYTAGYRRWLSDSEKRIYRGFDISEKIDLDSMITIAVNCANKWELETVYKDGTECVLVPAKTLENIMQYYYGKIEYDISDYSLYDAESPDMITVVGLWPYFGQEDKFVIFDEESETWFADMTLDTDEYEAIHTTCDENGYVLKTEFINDTVECLHVNRTHHEPENSTCVTKGHDWYDVCDDCNKVIEGSDAELPLADHDFVSVPECRYLKEEANSDHGTVYYQHCSFCNLKGDKTFEYGDSLAPEKTAQFTLTPVSHATKGKLIEIELGILNNPGIASARLSFNYDSTVMDLVEVKDGGILGTQIHSDKMTAPYTLCWENDTVTENFTDDGVLATLVFRVKENAPAGEYNYGISFDSGHFDVCDKDVKNVELVKPHGVLIVENVDMGDTDGDGKVTAKDRIILSRALADWKDADIEVILAADVDLDGKITQIDRIILSRYIAGWYGYEKYFGGVKFDPNSKDDVILEEEVID